MSPNCDLCSSPRAWLRIEERDDFGVSRRSIRIFEVSHQDNCWQTPGTDLNSVPTHSYDICANGHVRETGREGDRIKVCLLGPVGGGKSQLRETLMRIQAPRLTGTGGPANPFNNVMLGRTGRRFSPRPAADRASIGATKAASSDDLRKMIERYLQRSLNTSDDVITGFETVLHNALRATNRGQTLTDEQLNSWMGDWGRGRPPYLRSVHTNYHPGTNWREGDTDEFEVAFIDLPGEATSAWTDPNAGNYVGSHADVQQLSRSAHFAAIVDPLAAQWCLKQLRDSLALRLSLRPIGNPMNGTPAQNELRARGRRAREATEEMITVMTETLTTDTKVSASAIVVLTKCDAIRVILENTPPNDDELGRWASIIPRSARRSFEECALAAFAKCASRNAHNVDPVTWGFMSTVSALPHDQQMRIVRRLLAQLSDPQAFWALAHSGDSIELDFGTQCMIPVTASLQTDYSAAHNRTVPVSIYGSSLTVPTSNATWNAGLGIYRLQMRDVLSAIVVGAILSTIAGKNDVDQLLGRSLVRFALTSAWTRVDEDGEELDDSPDEDAGCLQVYRYILAPFLGHGVLA